MAESVALAAKKRDGRGTARARRLRKDGLVPAVVYGHKQDTLSLSVSHEELHRVVRLGTHVVDLQIEGVTEKAVIRDLQWDHLGKELLHIDLKRISEHERIDVTVRIELRGIAPGVTGGGVLDQPIHTLHVECPAMRMPESIRVNISELQLGDAVHVRDLVLPEGVKALADADAIVVHVTAQAKEPEPTAEVALPTGAEPEVIGKVKGEEEESEAKEKK